MRYIIFVLVCFPGLVFSDYINCSYKVVKVTEGDIVQLRDQSKTRPNIKLSGIDAAVPEPIPDLVPVTKRLLSINDFVYTGALRLSSATFGDSSVNYAIGTLAYNPTNHSLYIAGHAHQSAVAEFAILELLDRNTLAELNVVGKPLQSFRSILNAVSNPQAIDRITGMLYVDGQLVVNAEKWYDAPAANTDTTLVLRDAENIATSAIGGYYQLTGGAQAAGYMSPIPQEWQADFGVDHLTGWSNVYSIIGRYSVGPSLFAFDPGGLVDSSVRQGPIKATAFMNFPHKGKIYMVQDALRTVQGSASPTWNFLSSGRYGFIIPGTRTFAVFGSSGGINSGIGYKITQDTGNSCGGFCSYVAADNYNYYWLFNVQEILDATEVYTPQPYEYGVFSVPFDKKGAHAITGGAFDPSSKILYLSLGGAGQTGKYDRPPLIVGYQIN